MSIEKTILDSVLAYQLMLKRISLSAKIEMYQAIYHSDLDATDDMLSLGVAITADPEFQSWMNAKLLLPKP